MKINEIPEKIYLANNLFPTHIDWDGSPINTKKIEDSDIEFVRTDAFIKKACEYFHSRLEDTKVIDDYRDKLVRGISASYTSLEEFIEDFKNYIKGE